MINEISSGNNLHGGAQLEFRNNNPYRQMILDSVGPNFARGSSCQSFSNIEPELSHPHGPSMEEDPNPDSQLFYDLLQDADAKLYPSSSLSLLEVVSRMLSINMENSMSQRGYNQMIQLMQDTLPKDNILLDSYYQTKKLVHSLGLLVEKIDCCESGCLLYWGNDEHLLLVNVVAIKCISVMSALVRENWSDIRKCNIY